MIEEKYGKLPILSIFAFFLVLFLSLTVMSGGFAMASDKTSSDARRAPLMASSVIKAPTGLRIEQDPPPHKTYTLTIMVKGNGATNPPAGTHSFVEGTSVQVRANAASGAVFTGWSGSTSGNENPKKLTMNQNHTLTANFSNNTNLPDKCPGACDSAVPVHPTILDDGGFGNVTMYSTSASSGGACNYGTTDVKYYAAINVNVASGDGQGNWQGGKVCGQCAEVTVITSEGPKSVVVRILDKCPDEHCGIDLGGLAPGELMVDGFGRYDGQWRFVSCDGHSQVSDGPPSLDVYPGTNRWWSRVHVRNGATGVERISWQASGGGSSGTFPFSADPENTYEVPINDLIKANISSIIVTVHYVDGTTAKVTLKPIDLASVDSYPLN